jgi:hypothetical protein
VRWHGRLETRNGPELFLAWAVSLEEGAALEVIVREHEHDRFAAPALAEEAVLVAVCKSPADCDHGHSELIVESLGSLPIAGRTPLHKGDARISRLPGLHWLRSFDFQDEVSIGFPVDVLKS